METKDSLNIDGLPVLPNNWSKVSFDQLLIGGTRNGIYKSKDFHGSGAKIINMGELFAHSRIRDISMKRVNLSSVEQQRFSIQPYDLLFARRSLVAEGAGKCSIVLEVNEATTFESSIIRARPNPEIANSLFLYYFFSSIYGKQALGSILRQVAVAGITGSDLGKLVVPVPPLQEQRAIAHILGILDDKIELNRQMNETLEAMARALFKDWFVDFGPVRAKMAGQQPPGLAADIAALFPDTLDDEGKPVGWDYQPLSEFIELIGGGTPATSNPAYWAGDIPWFSVVDAPKPSDVFVIKTQKHITQLGLNNSSTRLLTEGTIIISARGTVGKLAIVAQPMAMNQSCYAIQSANGWNQFFVYFLIKNAVQELQSNTHGSVFDTITRNTFSSINAIYPPQKLGSVFNALVTPWLNKIKYNLLESETIAAVHDLLLPKLLSGELRVKDAHNIIEDIL